MKNSMDDSAIVAVQTLGEALKPIATQLSRAIREMERSFGPVLQRFKEASHTVAPLLRAAGEWNKTVDALNEVGWLPYHCAPFRYVEECGDDLALLDSRLSNYYRTQWNEIRDDMKSRLANYQIDDEARATFREALSAHEAELYRCVCRVLFPEIERLIGAGFRSRRLLDQLTRTGNLADYAFRERFGYVLFGRLVTHVYESGKRERFERIPIPNRHAAMHGLAPYSTHKHSMNMLILTDYIFQILPPKNESQA